MSREYHPDLDYERDPVAIAEKRRWCEEWRAELLRRIAAKQKRNRK